MHAITGIQGPHIRGSSVSIPKRGVRAEEGGMVGIRERNYSGGRGNLFVVTLFARTKIPNCHRLATTKAHVGTMHHYFKATKFVTNLIGFEFDIFYRPESQNTVADAFS